MGHRTKWVGWAVYYSGMGVGVPASRRRLLLTGTALCTLALSCGAAVAPGVAGLTPNLARTSANDLELTGLVPNLPPGRSAFLTYAQLAGLPQTTVRVDNDPNFPHPVRVTGVLLETLMRALRIPPGADLMDALCTDRYRAHYPGSYMAEHHPLLGLKIEGLSPAAWAKRTGEYDPSPYFITYAHFVPSFRILAHDDEAMVPSNVIRLNVTTIRATFDRLRPDPDSAEAEEGFTIAKQNCLRCHFLGSSGGTKSGRDWRMLSTWAREQPAFFQGYVRNPQAHDARARMPGSPAYDAATLAALTAYFRTFTLAEAPRKDFLHR